MPFDQYFRILATLLAISCGSGLLLFRPLKAWPAARWIDHPNEQLHWLYRLGLFLACLLLPMSVVWLIWEVLLYFWGKRIDPSNLALIFQASQLLVPIPFAFVLYRLLVAHVRTRRPAA
jgi:hypothetical protein